MAETWLWTSVKQSAAAGTATSASTSGLAEDPFVGTHEATTREYMPPLPQVLSCSRSAEAGLPGAAISGACCQAALWQKLLQALRLGTLIEALGWREAPLSACSVNILLSAADGCNLAVPAGIHGAVQSMPSHLSKARAVAGTEASSDGLAQGAILSDGEVQTGNACAYWGVDMPFHEDCWQASHSMGTAGKPDMAKVFLHLNADVNIELRCRPGGAAADADIGR